MSDRTPCSERATTIISVWLDCRVRGSLGTLLVFSCNLGILIAFVVGHYVSYAVRPIVLIVFPSVFLLVFSQFPESPVYLLKRGRHAEAEQSRRFYSNQPAMEADEAETIRLHGGHSVIKIAAAVESTSTAWSAFSKRIEWKRQNAKRNH